MKTKSLIIARWVWIALAATVLLLTLFLFDGSPNSDADVILAYGMLFLSFPISLVVSLISGTLGYAAFSLFGYVVTVSYTNILVGWLVFFIAGYWQWFTFLPWLWHKVRSRSQPLSGSST